MLLHVDPRLPAGGRNWCSDGTRAQPQAWLSSTFVRVRTIRRIRRKLLQPLHRINAVSTPVGGVSWTPAPSEREELRKLIVFLEDRRALFDPYNVEATILVRYSVQEIRMELTKVLQALDEDSRAADPLRIMRGACQRYLTRAQNFRDEPPWYRDRPPRGFLRGLDESEDFILALGELRGAVGAELSKIVTQYDVSVHGELAGLLPHDGEA